MGLDGEALLDRHHGAGATGMQRRILRTTGENLSGQTLSGAGV
jgi:hypothetical protein